MIFLKPSISRRKVCSPCQILYWEDQKNQGNNWIGQDAAIVTMPKEIPMWCWNQHVTKKNGGKDLRQQIFTALSVILAFKETAIKIVKENFFKVENTMSSLWYQK
jgi:hypothetical protein